VKIAQVITRMDTIGGAQVHVRDLSNHLAALGSEVVIISGEGKSTNHKLDVHCYISPSLKRELNPFYDVQAIFEVRKILKEIKPDLVATHSSKAGLIGRVAAWSLRIPTVFTAHGWAFTEGVAPKKRRFYIAIEKAIGKITHQVITVSHYDRHLADSNQVLPMHKMKTVHNGVLPLKPIPKPNRNNALVDILMVARFDVPKRQLNLIRACEKLRDLPWRLSFIGDGTKLDEARGYVEKRNLHDRVLFYGDMNNIEIPLSKSHLFVLLSDYEGLPLSILEAMQAGLPIIATDVGGVKEAVMDSDNGFLIPRGKEQLLIRRLTQLITDVSLRESMGHRSRELFFEKFTFDRMLIETKDVYDSVIQNQLLKGKT
jgi:glycosyltransferase involved in cell wall biosynthesis